MNTATIQAYDRNKSNRVRVQLDGQWYNVGNGVDLGPTTVPVGTRISFDSSSSDFNGKAVWWLNKYGQMPATTNGVHAQPPAQPRAVTAPPSGMSEGERLCVSNWIGHALGAGTIKSPDELDIWVKASLSAIRGERVPGGDDE